MIGQLSDCVKACIQFPYEKRDSKRCYGNYFVVRQVQFLKIFHPLKKSHWNPSKFVHTENKNQDKTKKYKIGLGLDFLSPIGLNFKGPIPVRAENWRAGPPDADPGSNPNFRHLSWAVTVEYFPLVRKLYLRGMLSLISGGKIMTTAWFDLWRFDELTTVGSLPISE